MAYTKTEWTGTTPINTTNLNKIEQGIEDAHNSISELSIKPEWIDLTPASGTWNFLQYRIEENKVTVRGSTEQFNFSEELICNLPSEIVPSITRYTYAFMASTRLARIYFSKDGIVGKNWAVNLADGTEYTGTTWLSFQIEYDLD